MACGSDGSTPQTDPEATDSRTVAVPTEAPAIRAADNSGNEAIEACVGQFRQKCNRRKNHPYSDTSSN